MNDISQVDMQEFARMAERASARTKKREAIKLGYEFQLSLYGVVKNFKSGEDEYRRIEVLSNIPYDQEIFFSLYEFFSQVIPPSKYSIWRYDKVSGDIKSWGVFE